MGTFGRCSRAVLNILPLRGRKRRMAKLMFLILLSGIVSMVIFSRTCLPGMRGCEGGDVEEGNRVEVVREEPRLLNNFLQDSLEQIPLPRRNIKGGDRSDQLEGVKQGEEDEKLSEPILDQSIKELNSNEEVEQKTQEHAVVTDNPPENPQRGAQMVNNEMESIKTVKSDEERRGSDDKVVKDKKRLQRHNQSKEHQILEGPSKNNAGSPSKNNVGIAENTELGQPKPSSDKEHSQPQRKPSTAINKREKETGSENRENKVEKRAGEKPKKSNRVTTATKNDPSTQSVSVKTDLLSQAEAKSLPPGVIAKPKKKVVAVEKEKGGESKANVESNNIAPGGAVRALTKEGVSEGGEIENEEPGMTNGGGGAEVEENGGGGGGGGVGGEGQEEKQMSAVEMAKAIESGQMCKTVCPPFAWSEWSPCSKACGKGRRYRKALYKFVCQTSELCPLNRIEETVCETPCKFDPEKYGGRNGLDMYPINPLNPAIYPEDKNYMCGHWLVEYEKLHEDILLGKRPPRYLVYSTGKGAYPTAGGIAPRIRGITTTFFLAVLLDRAFMIDWQDPPGLDQYLEPKSFNWADLSKTDNLKRGPVRDIGSWRSAKESSISSQWYMSTNFSTYFTNEVEVVQGHRYDFTYAVLRNPELMPKAFELGVDRIKCRICCAFHMLFKMTEKFQSQMDELLKSLGAPEKTIGAIQVRAKSHNVQDAVKHVDSFIKCATKAAKGLKLTKKISWVPIFNNRLVVHIVHKKYGDKLKIPINIDSATRTVHTHLGNLPADTELEVAKAVQERTFKEFFLTINSTVLIRKKGYEGSFGNIADAIRRFYHKLGAVQTFLVGNTCSKFPDTYKIE